MNSTYKTTVIGIALFLAAGITSAAVISSYGTITGTADVEPAVEILDVYTSEEKVNLTKNIERDIVSGDNMGLVNTTDSSNENNLATDIEMSSKSKNVSVDLANVKSIDLRIDGATVDNEGGIQ